MTKHYCDRCGRELPNNRKEYCVLTVKASGMLICNFGDVVMELCEDCTLAVMGADNVQKLKEEAEQRARKRAELKAAREREAEQRRSGLTEVKAR